MAPSINNSGSVRGLWQKYGVFDWILLIIVVAVSQSLSVIQPHHRYIVSENDPSINYPLRSNTVSVPLLIVLAGLLPFVIYSAIAIYHRRKPHSFAIYRRLVLAFFFSLFLTDLITNIIKKSVGRPRPNFVSMAQYYNNEPHATLSNVNEAYQSFPSGHSSFAFSGLVFLSLYIRQYLYELSAISYRNLKRDVNAVNNHVWKLLLVLLPVLVAVFIGVSRISDFWHNVDDVIAGSLLGTGIAVFSYFQIYYTFICHLMMRTRSKNAPLLNPVDDDHDIEDDLSSYSESDVPPASASASAAASAPPPIPSNVVVPVLVNNTNLSALLRSNAENYV